jgi:hypothetical protein
VSDVILNVEDLDERLKRHHDKIARARVWTDPQLTLKGELPPFTEPGTWPKGV